MSALKEGLQFSTDDLAQRGSAGQEIIDNRPVIVDRITPLVDAIQHGDGFYSVSKATRDLPAGIGHGGSMERVYAKGADAITFVIHTGTRARPGAFLMERNTSEDPNANNGLFFPTVRVSDLSHPNDPDFEHRTLQTLFGDKENFPKKNFIHTELAGSINLPQEDEGKGEKYNSAVIIIPLGEVDDKLVRDEIVEQFNDDRYVKLTPAEIASSQGVEHPEHVQNILDRVGQGVLEEHYLDYETDPAYRPSPLNEMNSVRRT